MHDVRIGTPESSFARKEAKNWRCKVSVLGEIGLREPGREGKERHADC